MIEKTFVVLIRTCKTKGIGNKWILCILIKNENKTDKAIKMQKKMFTKIMYEVIMIKEIIKSVDLILFKYYKSKSLNDF